MRFDVLTLFPEIFQGFLGQSLLKRAIDSGLLDVRLHNIRDWARDKHQSVDDRPFGGGAGLGVVGGPGVGCVGGGGGVAAMAVIEAVSRLVPGVLGDAQSNVDDSFSRDRRLLEYAQYTRPRAYRALEGPPVLLSGDHEEIARWRENSSR